MRDAVIMNRLPLNIGLLSYQILARNHFRKDNTVNLLEDKHLSPETIQLKLENNLCVLIQNNVAGKTVIFYTESQYTISTNSVNENIYK